MYYRPVKRCRLAIAALLFSSCLRCPYFRRCHVNVVRGYCVYNSLPRLFSLPTCLSVVCIGCYNRHLTAFADAKSLPGISAPFPQLFDPANLLGNAAGQANGINEVKRWRESEITHGRVAMLASLGFITQEQILGANAPRPFPHVQGEFYRVLVICYEN